MNALKHSSQAPPFSENLPMTRIFRTVLLVVASTTHCFSLASDATRPNFLLILADDLGYGDLGCYGSDDLTTPNIDRLAQNGLLFTDFYANGSVCSPTRAAFITGRYQQRIGMDNALYYQEMDAGLPLDGQTIADTLKGAGYATGLSGKWHLGYEHGRRPLEQGFDQFFGLLGGNHHYFAHMDRIGVPDLWSGNNPVQQDGYTTDLITEDAVKFIESHRDRPFFLYLSHAAPHFPWQGPNDASKLVEPEKKSWQEGDRETYVAMVEHMDKSVGAVLEKLDELKLNQNTLVVFTSDNGGHTWSDNRPLRGAKSSLWEGGIRVPCIARWPGHVPAGTTSDQVAITMDWTATFRQLAGCNAPEAGEDGIDLTPNLKSPATTTQRSLFWRHRTNAYRKKVRPGHAIRDGKWKLLDYADGEVHLFDLTSDISESDDQASRQPQVVAELRERIAQWDEEVSSDTASGSDVPSIGK